MCDGTFREYKITEAAAGDPALFKFNGPGMRRILTTCPVCLNADVCGIIMSRAGAWPIVIRVSYHDVPDDAPQYEPSTLDRRFRRDR
jgi:hypothetical protein